MTKPQTVFHSQETSLLAIQDSQCATYENRIRLFPSPVPLVHSVLYFYRTKANTLSTHPLVKPLYLKCVFCFVSFSLDVWVD